MLNSAGTLPSFPGVAVAQRRSGVRRSLIQIVALGVARSEEPDLHKRNFKEINVTVA